MTAAISMTGTVGLASELAELMIQNETNQEDSERLARDAARNAFLDNSNQQVAALNAAADASARGALFGAAFTIAGAACGIGADVDSFDAETVDKGTSQACIDSFDASILRDTDKVFSGLSQYASQLGGGTESAHDTAEAKRFETRATAAKWQADDASASIDKADKLRDKIMDIVQGINQDQTSANNAIIGRI